MTGKIKSLVEVERERAELEKLSAIESEGARPSTGAMLGPCGFSAALHRASGVGPGDIYRSTGIDVSTVHGRPRKAKHDHS